MKEQKRITVFIGTWACLMLASTSKTEPLPWFWLALACVWIIRYAYLKFW